MKFWEAGSSLAFETRQLEIEQRLRALTESDAARFGRMDVSQMLWHVRGAFAMALGERACARRRSVMRGPVGRYLVLASPMPWVTGYPTLRELVAPGDVGEFERLREGVVERVRGFCAASPEGLVRQHPLLGEMARVDWMRWGYRHTDHHLRQFGR